MNCWSRHWPLKQKPEDLFFINWHLPRKKRMCESSETAKGFGAFNNAWGVVRESQEKEHLVFLFMDQLKRKLVPSRTHPSIRTSLKQNSFLERVSLIRCHVFCLVKQHKPRSSSFIAWGLALEKVSCFVCFDHMLFDPRDLQRLVPIGHFCLSFAAEHEARSVNMLLFFGSCRFWKKRRKLSFLSPSIVSDGQSDKKVDNYVILILRQALPFSWHLGDGIYLLKELFLAMT